MLDVPGFCDLMFVYNSKEIADYQEIKQAVENILNYISEKAAQKEVVAQ